VGLNNPNWPKDKNKNLPKNRENLSGMCPV